MALSVLVLLLTMFAMFITVGLFFFRKGTHSTMWFLTLLPFLLNAGCLIGFYAGWGTPFLLLSSPTYAVMEAFAVVVCACAIAIFALTLGAHRRPIPMWHQTTDIPNAIVTWGPYAYVRHPFYSSYYAYYLSCVLAAPTWSIVLITSYAYVMLYLTAIREERQLLKSPFGREYADYMKKARRIIPSPWQWVRGKNNVSVNPLNRPHDISTVRASCDTLDVHPHRRLKEPPLCR